MGNISNLNENDLISKNEAGLAKVFIYNSQKSMAVAAAEELRIKINKVLSTKTELSIIFAAAPSQSEFLKNLVSATDIPWQKIIAFHMDDYVKLSSDAPQRFSNWLEKHLFSKVSFKKVFKIPADGNPKDICSTYDKNLNKKAIDIGCLGIGVNGHLAFNDPPVADFKDESNVKVVKLDEICRQQQVDDGCFETFSDVPEYAITLTIPQLLVAKSIFCIVPGLHKRSAVKGALSGPISTSCPASILRTHKDVKIFLDKEAGLYD